MIIWDVIIILIIIHSHTIIVICNLHVKGHQLGCRVALANFAKRGLRVSLANLWGYMICPNHLSKNLSCSRYLSFARSVCHQWVCMHFILTLKFPIPRVTSRPLSHFKLQVCQWTSIICRTGINCLEDGLPKNRLPLHPLIIMFPIKNCHWSCGLISIFKHSQPQVWSTDLQLCDFGRQ